MSLMKVDHLSAYYDKLQVLSEVSFSLDAGEVLALMGRNGMGKTTTIKSICRMLTKTKGNLTFDGQSLNKLPSFKVARLGIGLVPEGRRCFSNLTVEQNLLVSSRTGHWDYKKVIELFPILDQRKDQLSQSLSGGEQQMLAIGRALMTNPKLLILDEATEGLAPLIRQEIWTAINTLKTQTGIAILVVDKSLKELSVVADHAVILNRGKVVWDGQMTQLTTDLSEKFLGLK